MMRLHSLAVLAYSFFAGHISNSSRQCSSKAKGKSAQFAF